MNVNSKMKALADEVRELSGTSTLKGIDAMTADVNAANSEIASQTLLITQIAAALNGKAASEDISAEVNAYTEKLTYLESAVGALETELANKTGDGGNTSELFTVGTFLVTDQGMFEPGLNLFELESDLLQTSTRRIILIYLEGNTGIDSRSAGFIIYRTDISEGWRLSATSTRSMQLPSDTFIYENKLDILSDVNLVSTNVRFIAV